MRPSDPNTVRPYRSHPASRWMRVHQLGTTVLFGAMNMLTILVSSACLVASVVTAGNTLTGTRTESAEKEIGEYRRDVKSFISRSKTDDSRDRNDSLVELCLLHSQIVNDPRYQTNQQLQGFRAVAADRLKKCSRQIELEMLREQRQSGNAKPEGESEVDSEFNLASSNSDRYRRAASTEIGFETREQWLIEDMQAITAVTGGPIRIWNHIGGNHGGPACDYGPALVRLIETTIHPDFWRSGGGNGVIYYYQPLRILVISGSSRVHDEVTDFLRTMRGGN